MDKEAACPHSSNCELYEKFNLRGMLILWTTRYCDNEQRYPTCARYKLASKGEPVPLTLLPNGEHLRRL